jgi:hypothetical protein
MYNKDKTDINFHLKNRDKSNEFFKNYELQIVAGGMSDPSAVRKIH